MKMICTIFADDPVLRAQALKEIVDALVDPADRVFDVREILGDAGRAFDIITALESWPVGKAHKVVIVSNAERLTNEDGEKILEEAPSLPDFAVLVLVVDTAARSKLPAKLKAAAKDNTYQLGGATKSDKLEVAIKFVKGMLDKAGMKASHSVVSAIVGATGTECVTLRGEVNKLIDYCRIPGGYREITESIVDTVIAEAQEDVTFRLVDSICSGDMPGSLALLADRMRHTDDTTDGEAFRILALVRRQLLLLYQTKALLEQRIDISSTSIPGDEPLYPADSKYELRDVLKKSTWMARRLVSTARSMSWSRLLRGIELVPKLEEMMKNPEGMMSDAEAVMAYGVFNLCV